MRCDLENRRIEFILVEDAPAKKAAKASPAKSRSRTSKEKTKAEPAKEEKALKRTSARSKRASAAKTK